MFDSDALQPSLPSSQADRAVAACVGAGIPYHRLERRSIENYLPIGHLMAWAQASGAARPERLRKVRALGRLTKGQRAHWSMKGGFAGDDARNGESAGLLFDAVRPADRATLQTGFGDHVWEALQDRPIADNDLMADECITELRGMTAKLTRLLR